MIDQEKDAVRTRGRNINRAVLATVAVSALAVAGALGFFVRAQHSTSAAVITAAAKTERAVIVIEGMSCTGCAHGIKAMLKRTPGIVSAEVSFERREAIVEYDPARTSREKIVEAITNLGYKASIKVGSRPEAAVARPRMSWGPGIIEALRRI